MPFNLTRRQALKLIAAGVATVSLAPQAVLSAPGRMVKKPIPASGETIPVIGMGTCPFLPVEKPSP